MAKVQNQAPYFWMLEAFFYKYFKFTTMKNKQKPLTPVIEQKAPHNIEIQLQQPRHLFSLQPLQVNEQDFAPLFLDQKSQTLINSLQRIESQFSNNESFQVQQNKSQPFIPPASIIAQNQTLKKELVQLKNLYEQQKKKYVQLKDLYKEGQVMFSMLQDKKIMLQKENKEMKSYIEELTQQLISLQGKKQTSECSKSRNSVQSNKSKKTQKITIGSKKVPVIKVNVSENFLKKDSHANSTNSIYQQDSKDLQSYIKYQKEQIAKLKETNVKLQLQNDRLKVNLNRNFLKSNSSSYLNGQLNGDKLSMFSNVGPKETTQSAASSYETSSYKGSQMVNTFQENHQSDRKDNMIKNLQFQVDNLKSQLFALRNSQYLQSNFGPQDPNIFTFVGKNNPKYQMNQDRQQKQQLQQLQFRIKQKDKHIKMLQKKVQSLADNGKRLMADCNSAISKLQSQNNQLSEKNSKTQFQLTRLYKVLENKNIQLGQIYSAMKESRRQFSGCKNPFEIHLSGQKSKGNSYDLQDQRKRLF